MNHYGATPDEWTALCALGLGRDLLPVVSDPTATISPNSSLRALGKTPSCFNYSGHVIGITDWTRRESSPEEIDNWMTDSRLGICIKTGKVYGLDIDVDDPLVADQIEKFFVNRLGPLPCRVRENSGKRLLAVIVDGQISKRVIKTLSGRIELLGNGQQFVAVGTHTSGARYVWRDGLPTEIPSVSPDELMAAWREAESQLEAPTMKMQSVARIDRFDFCGNRPMSNPPVDMLSEGHALEIVRTVRSAISYLPYEAADDYDTWVQIGLGLKNLDLRCPLTLRAQVEALWHEFSSISTKYDEELAQEKWMKFPDPRQAHYLSVLRHALRNGWPGLTNLTAMELTDASNAEMLAEIADGRLRYVPEWRHWLYWDGTRWLRDEQRIHVLRIALSVSDSYAARLEIISLSRLEIEDGSKRAVAELRSWVRHSRSRRGLEDMLKLAMSNDSFVISASVLDTNKSLLGVGNGVVDLRTGQLKSAAKEDYVTLYIEVDYHSSSKAPRWERFVDEVSGRWDTESRAIQPRPQLARYLQKALGYMLTGMTSEHKMFVAIGEGANGKSVMFDTVEQIFKGYVRNIPPESLMATTLLADPERASPILASLQGARLAISSESKVGQKLDVALIKRHTGGGAITARGMRANAVTFEITHKLTLMTNARPKLDHLDAAIQGRLHIIPFDVRWNRPGSAVYDPKLPDGDKTLTEQLKIEREGILAWCVAGAVEYFSSGLEPPQEVLAMTRQFLQEEDSIGRWIEACSPYASAREGAKAAELFNSYRHWCQEQLGVTAQISQKSFSQELMRRGVEQVKDSSGTRYALKPPSEFLAESIE